MARYTYPAIFTPEEKGQFSVNFPDLEGCYTCGDNLEDAQMMAKDVLAFVLCDYEDKKREIPEPSESSRLTLKGKEIVKSISCDTAEYRESVAKEQRE